MDIYIWAILLQNKKSLKIKTKAVRGGRLMVKSSTFKEDIMKNNKYVYEDKNGDVHRNYKAVAAMGICNTLSLDVISINYGIDDTITTIFSDGLS